MFVHQLRSLIFTSFLFGFTLFLVTAQTKKDTLKTYEIPSITVTSTRAEKLISPIPFAELGHIELSKIYTYQDIPDLLSTLPSILFYSENGNSIGYSYLSMRGFDQRRISVLVNGIPQNDPEDHNVYWIDFPDLTANLESIQVQRGAGMSNYGAAAIGGSINMFTSNFTKERGLTIASGIGIQEYDGSGSAIFTPNIHKYSIEASSGFVDNYAFYGRLSEIQSDGYREKSWADLNSFFLSGVRFDDKLTTQINVFGGPISDGLAYMGLPKSWTTDKNLRVKNYNYWDYDATGQVADLTPRRKQEAEGFSQPHYEMLNDWKISENLTLKSAVFYYTGSGYFDYDGGYFDYDSEKLSKLHLTKEFGFPDSANPANILIRAYVGNKQGGLLPRLEWKHEDGAFIIGAEIRIHRSEHWAKIQLAENLPVGFDPDFKMYSYNGKRDIFSVFGQEIRNLSEKMTLTAELQMAYHSYRIGNERAGDKFTAYQTESGIVGNGDDLFNVKYLFLNPRIGISYRPDEHNQFYTSIAFTSREPRMSNFYDASGVLDGANPLFATDKLGRYDFTNPNVKPEKLLDFELGVNLRNYNLSENSFFGMASCGINIFWMEFYDELVKNGQRDGFGNPIDGNAPRSRHLGIEVECSAVAYHSPDFGKLDISFTATLSKNRIVEYNYQIGTEATVSLADNTIAGSPDFMSNVSLNYGNGEFTANLLMRSVGAFYTDNFNNENNKVDTYTVLNFQTSYKFKEVFGLRSLRLQMHVNNLANKLYAASGNGAEFFPAAERNIFFGIEMGI